MGSVEQHILSDMTLARPSEAISETPIQDHWLSVGYEGEVSGTMLWSPARNATPDLELPLPYLGRCEIHIGIYSSGTVPIWYNLIGGRVTTTKAYVRLRLRLSDEDWFDTILPTHYPDEPRFTHLCESYWKTADVSGRRLVFGRERKEAYADTMAFIAYVRLVPTSHTDSWPKETKRLSAYLDSNWAGHYVDSVADVKSHLEPLRDSDFDTVFWTTCREDTCYYPTKIGNMMPPDRQRGVYPYWAGRDMKRMLDRGEDPLKIACDVAHDCGLKLFASYRRMTCRMPPFVFPLHPDAMFTRRPDLWCLGPDGAPVPHYSLAYPDVRDRMVALFREQAERYDIDGVHMFFCRGMPFVYFEQPFLEAFREVYGHDPHELPLDDERVWRVRARFFLTYMRELRAMLDGVGQKRGRRFEIAMHVVNSVRTCAYYGIDVAALAGEGLLDLLIPGRGHFIPDELGEKGCTPEHVREFAAAVGGAATRVRPAWERSYWDDEMTVTERVRAFYAAGAEGLHASSGSHDRTAYEFCRRLGHVGRLNEAEAASARATRRVPVHKVGGFPVDMTTGIPTVG